MTIENKVVVITGAGSGMGRATAFHLAALGAKVVLGARREARIAEVARQITLSGGQAVYGQPTLLCTRTSWPWRTWPARSSGGSTSWSTTPASAHCLDSMPCKWRRGTR